MRLNMNEYTYIVALTHLLKWKIEKINSLIIKILQEQKLTFAEFFDSDEKTLIEIYSLNKRELEDLAIAKKELPNYAYLVDMLLNQGYEILPIYSKKYPKTLKDNLRAKYSPPLLYIKGNKEIFQKEKVAIVGPRNVSDKGIEFTKKITKKLVEQGNVIVSGFAKGVDRISLETALENEGQSIIVLPQGILTFSSGFKKHYQRIVHGDILVISTFYPKLPWSVGLAMGRNRYIYGLSNDIYVAESDFKGGTWAGVVDGLKKIKQFKMEDYRKIYVRYADENEKCANNTLIKQGAIGINEKLEIVKNGKPKERQQTLFDFNK